MGLWKEFFFRTNVFLEESLSSEDIFKKGFDLPVLVEVAHINETVDLKFDAVATFGYKSVPADLVITDFHRFDLAVTKF